MPISQTDALIQLISTLTKAEKRQFRLYARRNQQGESLKFLDLFNSIEKQKQASDQQIMELLPKMSKTQYANLKRHLYGQIMASLRIIHKSKRANIQVREHIDFAYILYGKGLVHQALKILVMAKREAIRHDLNLMHLTIVEFEKIIETRHITRSGRVKAQELSVSSAAIQERVNNLVSISNLRMELHAAYLKHGHKKNDQERADLRKNYKGRIDGFAQKELGGIEQIYLSQTYVWYHYLQLDFEACKMAAIEWINAFKEEPYMVHRDIDLFMRGYHYVLTACYHLKDLVGFEEYLPEFEKLRKSNYKKFDDNSKIISFLYVHTCRLNEAMMKGEFARALTLVPKTLKRIKRYGDRVDTHRILLFYFKIAWINFGFGRWNDCAFYLNFIVNNEMPGLRTDLQIYARIMFMMCCYEEEDLEGLEIQLKNYKQYIRGKDKEAKLARVTIDLFQDLLKSPLGDRKAVMDAYLIKMNAMEKDDFQKTAFTYLDVLSWLLAKRTNQPLGKVIREKIRNKDN